MTVPTERDQQTAQDVVLSVETDYDLSGDDYEAVIAAVAAALAAERRKGREDVLHALSNFVVAQELEALDEPSPTCRRHMMRTIDLLRALIEVEEVRP